jgi:hypothetical protein
MADLGMSDFFCAAYAFYIKFRVLPWTTMLRRDNGTEEDRQRINYSTNQPVNQKND